MPVGDIMRCLMYWQSYGDYPRAARYIRRIPTERRAMLAHLDYAAAERLWRQRLAIGRVERKGCSDGAG